MSFKIIVVMLGLLFTILSCTEKKNIDKVRIGINSWPGYEFLYLAHEKGFFKELGVETQIIEFNSLADARRAFEKGKVDIIGTTVVEQIIAIHQSNKNPQAFIIADYSDGADSILSKSEIKSIKQLKNKKVGVELGTVTVSILARALEKHNMTLNDVKIVKTDPETMQTMLEKGEVDAITSYPPFSINILKNKNVNQIFSTKEIPEEIIDVVIADKEYINKNKELIKSIIKAFEKAKKYAFQPGSDGMDLMAKRERISKQEFEASFKDGITLLSLPQQREVYFSNKKFQMIVEKTEQELRKLEIIKNEKKTNDLLVDLELLVDL